MPPPTSRRSTTSTRSTATSSRSRSRSRGWRAFRPARSARRSPDDRPADLASCSRRGRAPARGARALAGLAREARLRAQRAAFLRAAAEPAARLERPLRRDDEGLLDPHEGRARDDRRRRLGGEQLRVLHRRPLRGSAQADEGSAACRPDRDRPRKAGISDRMKRALDYALKLTRSPDAMAEEDVERLRDAGWKDEDVMDITEVTALFNFSNRMASGLGWQPNPEYETLGR